MPSRWPGPSPSLAGDHAESVVRVDQHRRRCPLDDLEHRCRVHDPEQEGPDIGGDPHDAMGPDPPQVRLHEALDEQVQLVGRDPAECAGPSDEGSQLVDRDTDVSHRLVPWRRSPDPSPVLRRPARSPARRAPLRGSRNRWGLADTPYATAHRAGVSIAAAMSAAQSRWLSQVARIRAKRASVGMSSHAAVAAIPGAVGSSSARTVPIRRQMTERS